MEHLGFKRLDLTNWLQPDPAASQWVLVSRADGSTRQINGDDYLHRVFARDLSSQIPIDVRRLFEVARATLAYGYLFYPLFTLATEQLFRVVEAGVRLRCDIAQTPAKVRTYEKRIEWLAAQHIVSEAARERLHNLRHLRNESSHPERQSIYPPGLAISFLETVAETLEELFNSLPNSAT